MPNIKSAIKRVSTNEYKNDQNASFKSAMRTAVRKFEVAADENADNAQELFKAAVKYLDKGVTKGVIHKNTANRQKARLARKLSKVSA